MKYKKVLITGSEGCVGIGFRKWFAANSPNTELILIDILTGNDCRDYFRHSNEKVALALHCAATIGGREGIENNPLGVGLNLSLDAEYFSWAMRTEPKKLVYFSSSAVYPVELQQRKPHYTMGSSLPRSFGHGSRFLMEEHIDLENPRLPDATYGWVKLSGELLADYARKQGLDIHVFRPFSGYCAWQTTDYPFPAFIQRAKNRENPFYIHGSGDSVRDWIEMEDIVNATMAALDQGINGPINLGCSIPTTFNELAQLITNAAGYNPTIEFLTDKPEGVFYRCSDNYKMLSYYQPKITLEEGIQRALNS